MEVQSDFKDLLELFNVHNVKYMIVGDMLWHFMVRHITQVTLIFLLSPMQKMPGIF